LFRCGRTSLVRIFLGIDGGGTRTTCALGDETSVLATATAGPSNIVRVGEERARTSLQQVIREVCAVTGITPAQVEGTCVGIAGAGRAEVVDIVRRVLSEVLTSPIQIATDMEISLHAAFGDGPGVIANAGTGSFAFGRDRAGRTTRAGGWGFAISDEGSGHWIGRTAVSGSFRAYDEGRQCKLLDGILTAWKLSSLQDLVRAANASPAPDFSSLLAAVLAGAQTGDSVAQSILTEAGAELARLVKLVTQRLFSAAESVRVAMAGSVLRESALVREVFYNSLNSQFTNLTVQTSVVEPVQGALDLARKAAHI
jgi:glucosamine kinase